MKKLVVLLIGILTLSSCGETKQQRSSYSISSPGNEVKIDFFLTSGTPGYAVKYHNTGVVDSSKLGFKIKNIPSLGQNLSIVSVDSSAFDETWEQPWGEERYIRNNYKELAIKLANAEGYKLNIIFRAFDNGAAFRYEFPKQEKLGEFVVEDELTEFNLANNNQAWWIPAYKGNRYEYEYKKSRVSDLDMVHTPLTMKADNDLYVSIHEAALYDYSSMVLKGTGSSNLKCDLVPYSTSDASKAYLEAPFKTPWRTTQIGQKPGDLITNYMILNLNEPNKLGDVSWVEPGKYIGVWWEMFVNLGTWHQGPKHAANTDNVKKYIDFAAEHGFDGVLVEGWNYGWDGEWMNGGTKFEFSKPYPDYDVDELSQYAAERDVYIIGHHETGADIENYDEQLEDAYKFISEHGMKTVKTGYVENGDTLPNGLYHHGQAFVKHFQRVIDMAAKYKTMIVAHEPIKDTGKRRTYPNMVSREGAKGQEYNAMGGNAPDHVTIIPFTRGLSGPFDYTPGVFDIMIETNPGNQVKGTLARELALYLAIYAPMQMANDLPKNYKGEPAFQFIKDVPTDWETTKVLDSEIGGFLTIARQEKGTENWFVGSLTNEKTRTVKIGFGFLPAGKKYNATVYRNSDDADYINNPTGYTIQNIEVDSSTVKEYDLVRAGGLAISMYPVD